MRGKPRQTLKTKLKARTILVIATSGVLFVVVSFTLFGYFNAGTFFKARAGRNVHLQTASDNSGNSGSVRQPQNNKATPQPITLLSYTVKAHQNNQILVNWITAGEKNNDYFTVERSGDGVNFSFLKNVNSKGTSNNTQYYTLLDEKPFYGINYYKLSHTDKNNNRSDVKTVKVEIKKGRPIMKISAWPNPFRNQVVIGVPTETEGIALMKMMDITGKTLHEQKVQIEGNQSELLFESLDQLPAGNYILKVYINDEISEGIKLTKY